MPAEGVPSRRSKSGHRQASDLKRTRQAYGWSPFGNPTILFGSERPSHVVQIANTACERCANTSPSTCVHARVTSRGRIPSVCGVFVAAMTRACPRFPPLPQDGKEGPLASDPDRAAASVVRQPILSCATRNARRAGAMSPPRGAGENDVAVCDDANGLRASPVHHEGSAWRPLTTRPTRRDPHG
jgi:hypothetical protein